MLKNILLTGFRSLMKRKAYTMINVAGLSIGLTAVIIIALFVLFETSYDRFHDRADQIYRIAWMSENPQTRTPHPMAQAIASDFAEVDAAVTLSPLWGPGLTRRTFPVKKPTDDTWLEEKDILGVDSTFFEVFDFELISGNEKEVLRSVGGILLSERMAMKYFNTLDVLGEYLVIERDEQLLLIEGVFKDVPEASHFHFDILVSYVTLKAFTDPASEYYTWNDFGHFNYIRVAPGTDVKALEEKLIPWAASYLDWDADDLEAIATRGIYFGLQPITGIHLDSNIRWELEPNGNRSYVLIMTAAALLILLIATFNFMNLSTAQSMDRANEVGVRKSLGADKPQLVRQFIGEATMMAALGSVIAGFAVELLLPSFNMVMGTSLQFNALQPTTLIVFILITLFLGGLAGIYPAIVLSGLDPISTLKGKYSTSKRGKQVRNALVVLQFAISLFLIAGAGTVIRQLQFLQHRDLGFNHEYLIEIPIQSDQIREQFETVREELNSIPGITGVSGASNIPGKQFNQNPAYLKSNPENRVDVKQCFVDDAFLSLMDVQFLEGRNFDKTRETDFRQTFVINKAAAVAFDLTESIGKELTLDLDNEDFQGEIIGVIADFHYASLHGAVQPLVIQMIPAYSHLLIKVNTRDMEQVLSRANQTLRQFDERFVFQYAFMDEILASQYANEKKMASTFTSFAILAIVVACMGLGGLASINFSFRKKEIGIRKVMGATEWRLSWVLIKEYTWLFVAALLLALPLYILVIGGWLQNFNYRVDLGFSTFMVSAGSLVLVAALTLSYLIFKTVHENPAHTLSEE